MGAEYVQAWLASFLLTLVVEVPVYVLVARGRCPVRRAALAGAAATAITHPLLWFAWVRLVSDYGTFILTGELLVAAVESLLFWRLARVDPGTAIAAAFLANASSVLLGLATRAVLPA